MESATDQAAPQGAQASEEVSIPREQYQKLLAAKEHDDDVRKKQAEVAKLKLKWDSAKNTSLAAKKSYDEAVDELQDLIAEANDPQQRLEFDAKKKDPKQPESKPEKAESHKPWKEISVDEMQIPAPSKKALKEAGVNTLGDYSRLQRGEIEGYPDGAANLKHWGSKKVTDADSEFERLRSEANEAAGVEEAADDENDTVSIRIVQSTNQMIAKGYRPGTVVSGRLVGTNAQFSDRDGVNWTLLKSEFEVVDESEAEADSEESSEAATEPDEPEEVEAFDAPSLATVLHPNAEDDMPVSEQWEDEEDDESESMEDESVDAYGTF